MTNSNSHIPNNAYTIAHSPDADDIFMYYAIKFGWVNKPYNLINYALDIESLNVACLQGQYDISAISFALYPLICNEYALLRTGMSFGYGYGPKIIKLRGKILGRRFKVALSGTHTTNALIFRLKYPDAKIIYKNFLEIEQTVLDGDVDAGVLIHESILNFSSKLEVETTIWDIWVDFIKDSLPLPLGGMAIRRSIPLNRAIILEEILTKAIQIALRFKSLLSQMLIDSNLVRVNPSELQTYLNLYANESSHTMDTMQLNALERLYGLGYNSGMYSSKIQVKNHLIPKEYKDLRYS